MTLFITSSPFDETAETPLFSNANGFVDRLRAALPEYPSVTFVASSPGTPRPHLPIWSRRLYRPGQRRDLPKPVDGSGRYKRGKRAGNCLLQRPADFRRRPCSHPGGIFPGHCPGCASAGLSGRYHWHQRRVYEHGADRLCPAGGTRRGSGSGLCPLLSGS